jgi:hypothetical protein
MHAPPQIAQRLGESALDRQMDVLIGLGNNKPPLARRSHHAHQFARHGIPVLAGDDGRLDRHRLERLHVSGRPDAVPLDQFQIENRILADRETEHIGVDRPDNRFLGLFRGRI